jgi:hypothetical protein
LREGADEAVKRVGKGAGMSRRTLRTSL